MVLNEGDALAEEMELGPDAPESDVLERIGGWLRSNDGAAELAGEYRGLLLE